MTDEQPFRQWAVLELMGHRRLAGLVSEATIAGAAFLRIDVPAGEEESSAATQFYAPAAVYAMTPVTEELARRVALIFRPDPVTEWDLRLRITTPSAYTAPPGDDVVDGEFDEEDR